jgi:outer membrane immunogenic protein
MMKRAVLSCISLSAIALSATFAAAADLAPGYAPIARTPAYYSPYYNWTGFYLGINGGGGWGRSQWDGVDTFDVSGGLIGGTIGYSWQFNHLVIGAEGDIDWSDINGTTSVLCAAGCSTRNDWLATVRGRVGYAFDRILPFLTAGFALGDINASRAAFPGGSITNIGWTVGAGVEVGVVRNVSLKAEYLFVDLGSFNCGFNCALAANGNVSFYANLFRAGLNVRF